MSQHRNSVVDRPIPTNVKVLSIFIFRFHLPQSLSKAIYKDILSKKKLVLILRLTEIEIVIQMLLILKTQMLYILILTPKTLGHLKCQE